jgi:hypothetical protein
MVVEPFAVVMETSTLCREGDSRLDTEMDTRWESTPNRSERSYADHVWARRDFPLLAKFPNRVTRVRDGWKKVGIAAVPERATAQA